jgi:type IV pilus assembly protein PilX
LKKPIVHITPYRSNSGFALITALLLLVGLMMLGVSSMNMSLVDEKLAGNVAHRNTTYQLAEAALRQGEEEVSRVINDETFNAPQNGWNIPLKSTGAAAKGWADPSAWANARTVAVAGAQSTQSIRYIIEELNGNVDSSDASSLKFQYLRVTASASDTRNNSTVVLQSIVRRARGDTQQL